MKKWISLTFKTKSCKILNQSVESLRFLHGLCTLLLSPTWDTSLLCQSFFPVAWSPLSFVTAHYPFPAPLATAIAIFAFFCNYIPHTVQAECHIFPVISNKAFFSKKIKDPWIHYPGSSWSLFLICFARPKTSPWGPLNNNPNTKLQTRFNFNIFCPVFPEMLFSQRAYNSPRSQPSS